MFLISLNKNGLLDLTVKEMGWPVLETDITFSQPPNTLPQPVKKANNSEFAYRTMS